MNGQFRGLVSQGYFLDFKPQFWKKIIIINKGSSSTLPQQSSLMNFYSGKMPKKFPTNYNFFFCKTLKRGKTQMFLLFFTWAFLIQSKQGASVLCVGQWQTQGSCWRSIVSAHLRAPVHTEGPVSRPVRWAQAGLWLLPMLVRQRKQLIFKFQPYPTPISISTLQKKRNPLICHSQQL